MTLIDSNKLVALPRSVDSLMINNILDINYKLKTVLLLHRYFLSARLVATVNHNQTVPTSTLTFVALKYLALAGICFATNLAKLTHKPTTINYINMK